MQTPEYREALEDAVRDLYRAENSLFTAMVNLGFKGTYNDISKLHDVGDVIDLEIAMFENTGDANLDALVAVIKEVAYTRAEITNLNAIQIELEDHD
jgi:spore germination protein GerM